MSMYQYIMSQFARDASNTAAALRQDAMALPQAADSIRAAADRSRALIEAARDKAWERGRQIKLDRLAERAADQTFEMNDTAHEQTKKLNPLKLREAEVSLGNTERMAQENAATSEGRVAAANTGNELAVATNKGKLERLPADLAAQDRLRDLGLLKAERAEALGAKYDEPKIQADINHTKAQSNQANASARYQNVHADEVKARTAQLEAADSPELKGVRVRDVSDRMAKLQRAWQMEAAIATASGARFTKPMPTADDARNEIAAEMGRPVRFGEGEAFKPTLDPSILSHPAIKAAGPGAQVYVSPAGRVMIFKGGTSLVVPGLTVKGAKQDTDSAQPGGPVTGPRPAAGKPKGAASAIGEFLFPSDSPGPTLF